MWCNYKGEPPCWICTNSGSFYNEQSQGLSQEIVTSPVTEYLQSSERLTEITVSLINIGNYTSYTLRLYPKTTKDRGEKMVNMYDTTAVDINWQI